MSNVIQFLESMGSKPAQARFPTAQYATAIASLDLCNAQRQALLDRDYAALNNLLEGRGEMLCLIATP